MNDITFSKEYMDFILPPKEVLMEEIYIDSLSQTEKELYFLRRDLLDGKICRMADMTDNDPHTCYEDAVSCILFWAVQDEQITQKESDELYEKYM